MSCPGFRPGLSQTGRASLPGGDGLYISLVLLRKQCADVCKCERQRALDLLSQVHDVKHVEDAAQANDDREVRENIQPYEHLGTFPGSTAGHGHDDSCHTNAEHDPKTTLGICQLGVERCKAFLLRIVVFKHHTPSVDTDGVKEHSRTGNVKLLKL